VAVLPRALLKAAAVIVVVPAHAVQPVAAEPTLAVTNPPQQDAAEQARPVAATMPNLHVPAIVAQWVAVNTKEQISAPEARPRKALPARP